MMRMSGALGMGSQMNLANNMLMAFLFLFLSLFVLVCFVVFLVFCLAAQHFLSLEKDVAGYKLYCMPGLVAEAAA